MVGWHHRLNGHELSKLREVVKDRGPWWYSPGGSKESDKTDAV